MLFTATLSALLAATAASGAAIEKCQDKEYDYVIVGGGLTGLVTAARLSEDPDVSVLVLEYGMIDRSNRTQIPFYATSLDVVGLRDIFSAPEPQLYNQSFPVQVSEIAGGGSQVNGMQWDLPSGAEFDAFEALGNPGWGWDGLKPYYKKATDFDEPGAEIQAIYNYSYDVSAHGGENSPVKISFPEFQYPDMYNFKDAFGELGVPFVEEHAFGNAVGQFWTAASINNETKTRSSSLYAYYDRVSERPNLKLLPMHQVTEIIFDDDLAATGVMALNRNNATEDFLGAQVSFNATKEVILAAGAVFTPQVLQLSGIGPKSVLEAAGVEVKLDFPAVGSNFQDHPTAFLTWNLSSSFPNPTSLLINETFLQESEQLYIEELTGPFTKAQSSYVGFLAIQSITENSEALLDEADASSVEDFLPEIYSSDERLVEGFRAQRDVLLAAMRAGEVAVLEIPVSGGGVVPNAVQKPLSRGTVHLNATNPSGVPIVLHNTFAHPFDSDTFFEGLNFTRNLFATDAMAPLEPVEVAPGADFTDKDETIQHLVETGGLIPTFSHPSCSCPMMPEEIGGVVSSDLLVYGTSKLSIVDASILPVIPAAHLQATMYSVAEKAADIIKARA